MISLTQKERETLLVLFKEFTAFYNANSISKVLGISHVGAQKIFARLTKENLLISKRIGKSIVHKLRLEDNYTSKLIEFILAEEANNFKRWQDEFKPLFKEGRIIILFGSCIKNYEKANDIDLMIILEKKEEKEIDNFLKGKRQILPKKLHTIKLTYSDLLKNIKKKDKVIVDIIKNGIVLYGQEKLVEVMKNVAVF